MLPRHRAAQGPDETLQGASSGRGLQTMQQPLEGSSTSQNGDTPKPCRERTRITTAAAPAAT
jgi:hypothetical protein